MEALPISNPLPTPVSASADNAVDPTAAQGAQSDGEFHDMLCRNLKSQANGEKDAPVEDAAGKDDESALAALSQGTASASDSALALLAALPQQAARADGLKTDADHRALAGDAIAGGISGATPREAPALPGAKAAARPGDGLLQGAETDKAGEKALLGKESLPEFKLPGAAHDAQAAMHAAHMAQPTALDPAAAGPAPVAAPRIETPLGAPGWSSALADQVVMFVNEKQQVAELHINPPHLGPVDITLTVNDDQATAVFASPHAVVRETLESALPRLREVLAESGINLGQASVTADSPRDGSYQAQTRQSLNGEEGRSSASELPRGGAALAAARRGRGLVDLFA